MKNRGVKDILIVSVDGLSGFVEAIAAAFPQTEVQRCIIHQIRASTRYASYKDLKAFSVDLKPVYKAVSAESVLLALDDFEAKWGQKYPLGVKSWRNNLSELATMFKHPEEIRTIIYTTNATENLNRQFQKVTNKWTMPIRNLGTILNHLMFLGKLLQLLCAELKKTLHFAKDLFSEMQGKKEVFSFEKLNDNSIAVIYLVLDYLCSPAGKGFNTFLKAIVLVFNFY